MSRAGTRSALGRPLPRAFYDRPALAVARAMMGRLLVHAGSGGVVAGRIVEVEAYCGELDPASHAFRGPTARNAVMFGPPGHAYVYLSYGMHYCLNLVVEREGRAAAVLIRALDPVAGIAHMKRRRRTEVRDRLARGPGCVGSALGITPQTNGADLVAGPLWLSDLAPRRHGFALARGPRIGIARGLELPWRLFFRGHPCVSGTNDPQGIRRAPGVAIPRRNGPLPR